MKSIAPALLALVLGAAAPASAQTIAGVEFADWTSGVTTGTPNDFVSGTLFGRSITISGGSLSGSQLDGGWNAFTGRAFTPPIPLTDEVQLSGGEPPNGYTLSFGAPVTNPVLELFSLGSTLTFPPGTRIERLSGDDQFTVSGNTVNGVAVSIPAPAGPRDPNGTVRLVGTFTSIPIETAYALGRDGIPTQVGAPVPAGTANSSPTPTPTVTSRRLPPDQPPLAGVRVSSAPTAGDVKVKVPGGQGFVPLTEAAALPVGSVVDARSGTLTVRATSGTAIVSAGIFAIRQAAARHAAAAFVLRTPPGQARACAGRVHKGVVRELTVVSRGVIRTVAAKGVVTGRNAAWTVADRCNGTLTKVRKGRVTVAGGHLTRTVRAGHSLLIRARLFAARQRR